MKTVYYQIEIKVLKFIAMKKIIKTRLSSFFLDVWNQISQDDRQYEFQD